MIQIFNSKSRLMVSTTLILCLCILFPSTMSAQMGCTDVQALNYDAAATQNDGSCIYPTTNYGMTSVATLSSALQETSGLAIATEGLWTHNDGGNSDEIYRIDSLSGAVLQTILVANGENEDWEDMAEDDNYLYIGDFGNNNGNRTDLRIYRVDKNNLGNLIVSADVIEFSYSDQTDFTILPNNNNYDCEAFFYLNDSLYLFTKNWADNQTRYYSVPATPGSHTAELRGTFNSEGLITGADVNEDGIIALIGYTSSGINFMWLLFDYPDGELLAGNKRKINLGTGLTNSQTEGIVFSDQFSGFVSSENFNILPARLLRFSIQEWVDQTVSNEDLTNKSFSFRVAPNPIDKHLRIESPKSLNGTFRFALFSQTGQVVFMEDWNARGEQQHVLNLGKANLSSGTYYLRVEQGGKLYFQQIVKMR